MKNKLPFTGLFKIRAKLLYWFPKIFIKGIMSNIKRFLHDAGTMRPIYDHLYARFILSFTENTEFSHKICGDIARWIANNKYETLLPTLTDIYTSNNNVYIKTLRPGLWIGKAGMTIDSLTKYIRESQDNPDIEINLVEEKGNLVTFYSYYNTYSY